MKRKSAIDRIEYHEKIESAELCRKKHLKKLISWK
jgi:hypothetical protein